MIQLILHLLGDYVTQSDWMALNKRKDSVAAFAHALMYSAPFAVLAAQCKSPLISWSVIFGSHFLIDRFGLARYVVWAKNWIGPDRPKPFAECSATGYDPDRPAWLAVWLMIAADNTLHLAINYVTLKYL